MPLVTIKEDECKGCALCTTSCPKKIVVMSTDKLNIQGVRPAVVTDMEKCIGCAMCATMCPICAIKVEK